MSDLAIHGGAPVRTAPFPTNMVGASLIGAEELAELSDVVKEQSPFRHYGVGHPTKVKQLEEEMSAYFGCKYTLAVSSGTAALVCAVAAAGLGPGDEVVLPAFSWYSDYCALVALGVTPVFADVGEDLNLDPDDFQRKIGPRTKAVVVVHYQGCPAQMDRILPIARSAGLTVIEDAAQAMGGTFRGGKLGTLGDIAIFSFQTHKMLTAGEGGLVMTNHEQLFVRAVRYHDLGFVRPVFAARLEHPELAADEGRFAGVQLRMSELGGAFLLAQLRRLDGILATCRRWHGMLCGHLSRRWPTLQIRRAEGDCGIALILLLKDAETARQFTECLTAEGIPCGATSACCNLVRQYPICNRAMPHPALPPFGPGFEPGLTFDNAICCPNTDGILARTLALGIGPTYTEAEIRDMTAALDKVCAALL